MPTVDSTRSRTRTDQPDTNPTPTSRLTAQVQLPRGPSVANDHTVDASVVAAALNDRILYVGMNAESRAIETRALGNNLTVIAGASSPLVTLGAKSYDMTRANDVHDFVQQLARDNRLSLTQCEQLKGILLGSPASGRDEVAKIAALWATAERGASIPSRVVLSGHSSYGMTWGDHDVGYFHFQAVRDLGKALPKAAAQIEDLHVSGCFSENEVQHSENWTGSFPNLKTVWAYGAFSPHAPADHLAAWRGATVGRATRLSEAFVAQFGSATAWSLTGGIAHATSSVEERRQRVEDADLRFDAYFSGQAAIHDAHDGAADRDYGAYQMLASHREATPSERSQAVERGGQMLRLRFWESSVRAEIAKTYGRPINDALTKAGLDPVDFTTLSRKEALAVLERYREANGGKLGPIMEGIAKLSPTVIPASFCH